MLIVCSLTLCTKKFCLKPRELLTRILSWHMEPTPIDAQESEMWSHIVRHSCIELCSSSQVCQRCSSVSGQSPSTISRLHRAPSAVTKSLWEWRTLSKFPPRTKPASGNWADCEWEGQGGTGRIQQPCVRYPDTLNLVQGSFFLYLNLSFCGPGGLILFPLPGKCCPAVGKAHPVVTWPHCLCVPCAQGRAWHRIGAQCSMNILGENEWMSEQMKEGQSHHLPSLQIHT